MSDTHQNKIKFTPPIQGYAIDFSYLKNINGLTFTPREIDILACIISGRTAKKIATFLSISSRTVGTHIYNIMLKIGCNSQEHIIDFIEKSDNFILLKKHYLNLQIQTIFVQELKKIIPKIKKKLPSCKLLFDSEQKNESYFSYLLEYHLKIIGLKITMEDKKGTEGIKYFIDTIDRKQDDYIIYNLPLEFSKQFLTGSNKVEIIQLPYFMQLANNNKDFAILLLFDNASPWMPPKIMFDSENNDSKEQENYYSLFFKILKKLLPLEDFEKHFIEFKKQYTKNNEPIILQIKAENFPLLKNYIFTIIRKNLTIINSLALFSFLTLSLFFYPKILSYTSNLINFIKVSNRLYPTHNKYGLENIQWVIDRPIEAHQKFLESSKKELVMIQRYVGSWNTDRSIYQILHKQIKKGVKIKLLILDPNSSQSKKLPLADQQNLKQGLKRLIKFKTENPSLIEIRLLKDLLPFAMDMIDCNISADPSIKTDEHSRINIHPKTAIESLSPQSVHTMLIYSFRDTGERSPFQVYRNMILQIWSEYSTELEKSSFYKILPEEFKS